MKGRMRVWRLRHGIYRVKIGMDKDHDHKMDRAIQTREMELAKADSIDVDLAPGQVTVIEVSRLKTLPSIFTRADLALASRETRFASGQVTGVLHNIGAAEARNVHLVVQDAAGRIEGEVTIPSIDAPLDLNPRRVPYTIRIAGKPQKDWRVVADPEDRIPEINESNNTSRIEPPVLTLPTWNAGDIHISGP